MIDAPASKSFSAPRGVPQRNRISPLAWMNLVCLDAPLVAVSWHWLFAREFAIPVAPGTPPALFLTAWLIYLADRFVDSLSVDPDGSSSLRQRFCFRHRRAWLAAIAVIALGDVFVVLSALDPIALAVGSAVAAAAFAYLLVNQLRPQLWRLLPLKEVSIGFIFAAGVMVGLMRNLPASALLPSLLFAVLCATNCICIAFWERGLDTAQRRISIATEFGGIERLIPLLLAALCANAVWFFGTFRSVTPALAASAALLGFVHIARARLQADVRTALADLVLLTPLAVIAFS